MDICVVSTFWLLWVMRLWIFIHNFLTGHMFSIFLCLYLGAELLGHMVTLCLNFWGNVRLFSKAAAQFYIPTSRVRGFQCLHILTNTYLFDCSSPNDCDVVSHCNFNLHFPGYQWSALKKHLFLDPIPGTLDQNLWESGFGEICNFC